MKLYFLYLIDPYVGMGRIGHFHSCNVPQKLVPKKSNCAQNEEYFNVHMLTIIKPTPKYQI